MLYLNLFLVIWIVKYFGKNMLSQAENVFPEEQRNR